MKDEDFDKVIKAIRSCENGGHHRSVRTWIDVLRKKELITGPQYSDCLDEWLSKSVELNRKLLFG